jgi:hypothetical protein
MSEAAEKRKEHRAKQAGPKARGKKAKEARKAGVSDSDRKKNPKVRTASGRTMVGFLCHDVARSILLASLLLPTGVYLQFS